MQAHKLPLSGAKKSKMSRQIILKAGEKAPKVLEVSLSGSSTTIEVHLGAGAEATIFDVSTSKKHAVSVTLQKGSVLTYISLSRDSARTFTSSVDAGARMHWHCTTLGGDGDRHTLISRCIGANAKSTVDWIFSANGKEKQSVSVRNIFDAPEGGGEITLQGVAEEKAFVTCHGMIEITEKGRGTNTYLTEDVLMLDSTAHVDAVPALEIRTNDVKASHSATVSRVTAENLFYLQSRGIDEVKARQMFVEGFLGALTERIADEEIRARVKEAIVREVV